MAKLTRRGLLGMLGIGTAAAPVLPAIAKAVAETPEIVPNNLIRDYPYAVTMLGTWSGMSSRTWPPGSGRDWEEDE